MSLKLILPGLAGPEVPHESSAITDKWLQEVLERRHGSDYQLVESQRLPLNLGNHVSACSELVCIRCRGRIIPASGGFEWTTDLLPDGCNPFEQEQGDAVIKGARYDIVDNLIVKMMPQDEQIRQMVTSLRMPQCETTVYSQMLPDIFEFERQRGSGSVREMVPNCLFARLCQKKQAERWEIQDPTGSMECGVGSPTENITAETIEEGLLSSMHTSSTDLQFVIVLENLLEAGYETPDQLQLGEGQLLAAAKQLARFAATSNAWLKAKDIHSLPYLMEIPLPKDHIAKDFIKMGVAKIEDGLKERGEMDLVEKLHRMQEKSVTLISEHLKPPSADLRVIAHGDFRGGNFIIKENADHSWDVKVIDWQVSMLSHPVVDLVYLLMLSIPRDVMKRVETQVLDLYYDEFERTCATLNTPCPLTKEHLQTEFRRAKLLGLMWCLSCMTFWDRVQAWPEHCTDIALEVHALGLLDNV